MTEMLLNVGAEFWHVLCEMAPYLLFGFLMAGLLSVFVSPEAVEQHLGRGRIGPVIKASAFGVPLPLCSCGVIPVAASLRRHGASRGATTAFLLSTPQTGVDSIMVTLSLLGPVFAVFRPLAALLTGVVGGTLVTLLGLEDAPGGGTDGGCKEACCAGDGGTGKLSRALTYGFVTLPRDIGRALLIGLIIAGIISALVTPEDIPLVLKSGIGAMLVMMLAGIPVYVCATASVPVAAVLMYKGLSPGAAMVFLMTGPATNAAAIATIWKVLGKWVAVVYLGVVAASALGCGLLLDLVVIPKWPSALPDISSMTPGPVGVASGVALLALLLAAILWRGKRGHEGHEPAEPHDEQTTVVVSGMTCSHCAESVRKALLACPGVESVEVDLGTGRAAVVGGDADVGSLRGAVEELGFEFSPGPSGTQESHPDS